MKLRGIEFGPVLGASGVQGWFGEGYPYHRYARFAGLSFGGMTLVSKTTTLNAREGNMPMKEDGVTVKGLFPKCVVVKWWDGVALNSVGLSGPGADALFRKEKWRRLTKPFLLSFMSVAASKEERLDELVTYCAMLMSFEIVFNAPVGLQINFSCPNTGHDPENLVAEVTEALIGARQMLGEKIPIMPKFNALIPPEVVVGIQEHCDAVCVSNTIPWGMLPDKINWLRLFPRPDDGISYEAEPCYYNIPDSPLAHLGGGGLSGTPLLPLVCDWVKRAKAAGLTIPINAGGGIMRTNDIRSLIRHGLDFTNDSVFLGSVAFLRPWRVRGIITRAHRMHGIATESDCYVS